MYILRGRVGANWESVTVEVAPVHRSDNDYNSNAISVAMPESFGGTVHERHMGYLNDSFLRKVGMTSLPDLAATMFGEITCTAILYAESAWDASAQDIPDWAAPDLMLDVPEPQELGRAIDAFLSTHTTSAPIAARDSWRPIDPRVRRHTQPSSATSESLAQIRTFSTRQLPVGHLIITAIREDPRRPRWLHLSDAESGRHLGKVAVGHLFLEDERDRLDVLARLAEADIPVAQPAAYPMSISDNEWPNSTVPNMWTYWFPEKLDFRPRDPRTTSSWTSIAHYNPTTKKLWVQDSRLVAPACVYAARLGLDVAKVGLPRTPWALDAEIPWYELKDPNLRVGRDRPDFSVALLVDKRDLIPVDLLRGDNVRWTSFAPPAPNAESDTMFILHERHVRHRQALFGNHRLTATIEACRFCGLPGLEFASAICVDPLTYCQKCLTNAATGVIKDRGRAAQALRLLATYEFGDIPMLETQLDSLHVNDAQPVQGVNIDRLLLLRFAIARRQHPWTHLLEEAGFTTDGLRLSRGTLIRARDGHLCYSLGEREICDFFHQHEISHQREPFYPVDAELNPSGRRRADWLLDDGTFVELWGMPNNQAYAAKMAQKRALATRHGLTLVELTDADLKHLPEMFAIRLLPDSTRTTSWKWSPVLASQTPVRRRRRPDGRGHEYNSAIRQERLARCRQAVELQSAGHSRRAISYKLKVGPERVKILLRDGKFYADPTTDAARLGAANAAAEAKDRGLTRAQFQAEQDLSPAKAQEAWRDCDVIIGSSDK